MRRTFKGFAAVAALVVPIAVGWAYTAGASVGESDSGIGGLFADETVDEFLIDGYLITRESHDGVVTMTVVGPDGAAVLPADLPADIAEEVSYFESDWYPEELSTFEVVDGVACYAITGDLGSNSDVQMTEDTESVVRAMEAETDGDGNLTAQARQWDFDDLTSQQRDQLASGDIRFADLPDGTELLACAD